MHSKNSTTLRKKRERDLRYCASHREEAKIRARKWYYDNHDKARKTRKVYARKNKESIKKRCREYYLKYSDRIKARVRLWRINNKERKADFDKKWVALNI